ncbi:MAG TPA: class I SAM-dependent methyltransferase [Acidobacteriaceae bacterium]
MKLNLAEKLLVNNPARALVQCLYEGPLLRRLGGRLDGAWVLDVGCGRGVGVQVLLEQFGAGQVYGVDLDPEQIRLAQRRFAGKSEGRVVLAVGSVLNLPFPDEYFDAVFDFGMLHHVVDWQAGVAEIRRVLKPSGLFFFEEVTRDALNRWIYRTFLDHPTENRFSEMEFLAELSVQKIEPLGEPHRVLLKDIFIGIARRISRTSAIGGPAA